MIRQCIPKSTKRAFNSKDDKTIAEDFNREFAFTLLSLFLESFNTRSEIRMTAQAILVMYLEVAQ